jgi:hypothetical protein
MKKKKLTLFIAAALTLIGSLCLHEYMVHTNQLSGIAGLCVGCLLLYPSVKGWAELIEPSTSKNEEEAQ